MPGEDAKKTASKDNLASAVRLPNSRYGSKSNLFNATGSRSNMAMDQATLIATALESGQRVYENSYKMRPERKYRAEPVQRLIDATLKKHLTGVPYAADKVAELVRVMTAEILAGVKEFNFDRYKFVVDVTVCEAKGQGLRVASRCLWDTTTDSCSSASFKSSSLFAVGVVFGCYFE